MKLIRLFLLVVLYLGLIHMESTSASHKVTMNSAAERLQHLIQTGSIKEQMYRDKLNILKGQLESLKNGTHEEYVNEVKRLKLQKHEQKELNTLIRDVEIERIQREYQTEIRSIRAELEEKKVELRESLIAELEEKRKQIENEYQNLDLISDSADIKPTTTTRKLRRRPNEPLPRDEKRQRKASPSLKFLLQDNDVESDLKSLGLWSECFAKPNGTFSNGRSNPSPASRGVSNGSDVVVTERHVLTPGDSGAVIDNGKLFYENKCYLRGQTVYVETSDTGKIPASIQSIGDMEVTLKSVGDNKRICINLWELRDGKAILRKRSS